MLTDTDRQAGELLRDPARELEQAMKAYGRLSVTGVAAFALLNSPDAAAQVSPATDTFEVRITILAACTVVAGAPSDIDFGSVAATDVDIPGDSSITVNCSNSTPYFIGLEPSNGDDQGAGEMTSTGTSVDLVPYQLYQDAGLSTIWGNTATSAAPGNGVAGTGTGLDQLIPVYAEVPSANFTPDSYADTVTVNVNY